MTRYALMSGLLFLFAQTWASLLAAEPASSVPLAPGVSNKLKLEGTHEVVKDLKLQSKDGTMRLQTLTVDGKGRILGLVARPRSYGAPIKATTSEIHVHSADGTLEGIWTVAFHANSINTGSDDKVYVAGDGTVAVFSRDGKQEMVVQLPHIKELLANPDLLKKRAEQQIENQKKSFAASQKSITEQKKKLETIKPEERTAIQKKQLAQYELILKSYANSAKYYDSLTVESVVEQLTARMRTINGIAISEKDVFIACGEAKGFGFAIWRMTKGLKEAKQLLSGVSGCCGQMDIQVSGQDFLLAENTRHRFSRYSREGTLLGSWGKNGKESEPGCFGGCCNPMNLRALQTGDIYTAESEGIIKHFSATGEFLDIVGQVSLTGGCKNVAVGASPDGSKVYFCDQPGSRIIVMRIKK